MSTVAHAAPRIALIQALPDLRAWTAWFSNAEIPVHADTAETIEALRVNEDAVDANLLGELIATDPLMTLKLMAHASTRRSARQLTDPETVTSALVMMGISPFFRDFREYPIVEQHLCAAPSAIAGLREVVARGRRAANFALAFAVHRLDDDTPVIHQAALLHDFAEMLMWVHSPMLALRMQAARDAQPARRSVEIQREVFNVELSDLQQSLMKAWRLPDLLTRVSDDKHADHPSVRTVLLAVRVARHSSLSWANPALPDDIADLADLLQLSPAAVSDLLADIDR